MESLMSLYRNTTWSRNLILLILVCLGASIACKRMHQEKVLIQTSLGNIELEIYPGLAPVTAHNFLSHVDQGTYTNSQFYRVVRLDNQPQSQVKIEVIQGGLFEDELVDDYTPIEHENTEFTGIKHTDGVISMARNEPGSASTEFFICIGDQPSLDYGGARNPDGAGFAAFGKVVRGMEVVRAIQNQVDKEQYLIEKISIYGISRFP